MNAESPPQPLSGPPSPTLRAQIWEARRENARLKAELEAEAAAARSPDPAKANSTTEKAAVETAETVENASPPGPLKVPLAPTAHPVLRAAIVLMVKSGNAPRPPKEIAALLRTAIDNQVTPDLGHLFDADPAGTVSMTLSGYVSSCAREGKRCAIGREKAERGSLYYVDVVGADRANDVEFVSPDEFDEDPIVGNHPSRSPSPSSTTPLDPLYNLLSSRERNLCRHLNLPPAAFLDATAHLEDECKRRGGLNESEASALSSWRVWETGQWNGYWTHLLRFGYVWVPSRKRGRQQIGDETALLHRVQPMYRTVEDGVATVKYADLQAEEPKRRIGKDRGALEPPKQVRTGDDELFVETNERIIWSLTCPACPKTAFPSLQAYVNHVRISHGLYFPSHAEAVRTLGKQVSPEQAVELRVKASAYAEKLKREMDVARVDTLGRRVPITQQQLSVRRERPDPIAPKEKEKKVKVRGQFTRRRRDGVEVLIACPECGRDDISTMQGFIKHLGTHGIPQLSVDDAIDLYGVPINNAGSASGENEAMMVVSRAPAKKVSPLSLAAQDVKVESEYGSVGPGTPETGYGTEDGTVADAALWELRVPRSDGVIVRVVCPDCQRSDFPNLQSFVLHISAAHERAFTSVDDYGIPIETRTVRAVLSSRGRGRHARPKMGRGVLGGGADSPLLKTVGRQRSEPSPLDIRGMPFYDELDEGERMLASTVRISPELYLTIKRMFSAECEKQNGLAPRIARQMVKIDVNKSGRVWTFLADRGLVWKPGRRLRGAGEGGLGISGMPQGDDPMQLLDSSPPPPRGANDGQLQTQDPYAQALASSPMLGQQPGYAEFGHHQMQDTHHAVAMQVDPIVSGHPSQQQPVVPANDNVDSPFDPSQFDLDAEMEDLFDFGAL